MENWHTEPDFSWMSFKPEDHGITPRLSVWPGSANSSHVDQGQPQQPRLMSEEKNVSRRWSFPFGVSQRKQPLIPEDDVVEGDEDEEEWLMRRRKQGTRTPGRKLYEPSTSSASATSMKGRLDDGDGAGSGGLWRGLRRRSKWMYGSHGGDAAVSPRKTGSTSLDRRLQYASKLASYCCLLAMAIGLFLFYLSFGATARPPQACQFDNVVLNFTAQRIRLRGGRYISFREQGVSADKAEHSVLVVHDLLSSRLAGIPGISGSLLTNFGVRLVSYDRPGYGQSDPHFGRSYHSSALDMSDIADALGMGEKFWVFGFGNGGPHVWAAINYIPERIAGVALFAPAGNFYEDTMTREEIAETWDVLTLRQRWMYAIAHYFPALLPSLMQKTLVNDNPSPLRAMGATLGYKDQLLMEREDVLKFWNEDSREALQQRCAFPMTEELILLVDKWGFRLKDLPFSAQESKSLFQHVVGMFQTKEKRGMFSGPIHVWQGTDDPHVPGAINKYAKRIIDKIGVLTKTGTHVNLHTLEGEGHMSWTWFCDECHETVFISLFQPEERSRDSPTDRQGFSPQEFDPILAAYGDPKEALKRVAQTKDSLGRDADWFASTAGQEKDVKADKLSNGMVMYVPEKCNAPTDLSTTILRAIEDRLRKYMTVADAARDECRKVSFTVE